MDELLKDLIADGRGTLLTLQEHIEATPTPAPLTLMPSSSGRSPSTSGVRRDIALLVPDKRVLRGVLNIALQRSGLRPSELARRLGISRQTVNSLTHYEHNISFESVVRILMTLGAKVIVEFPSEPVV